ncbi:hypothetical protein K8Z61_00970 [Nocardioides sp. TRM66260-LWL]|uniref:DUF6801 domain-containing protein n=1 Tax=Nocardioides sp. TRM66260-LWL TaxID=2874478 RepID=UPI001CC3EFB6|nr:DUF6801 domain-containing protein [Nocardioides sp. TRM66260-LWL]MBZ5733055.1 hypothetical protein [Nocardioides sp. TRM66260-LWL]
MTRSRRTPVRALPGLLAVLALVASSLTALTGLTALTTAAAQAATRTVRTTYSCASDFGTQRTAVRISADFPSSVRRGSTVAARRVGFAVTVPKEYVGYLRQFGVRSVSGVGSRSAYRVGSTRHALTGVRLPRTKVPSRGALVLRGGGTAASFRAPAPGRYAVQVPASFRARLTVYTDSGSNSLDLRCSLVRGAPSRIGTLTVR